MYGPSITTLMPHFAFREADIWSMTKSYFIRFSGTEESGGNGLAQNEVGGINYIHELDTNLSRLTAQRDNNKNFVCQPRNLRIADEEP